MTSTRPGGEFHLAAGGEFQVAMDASAQLAPASRSGLNARSFIHSS